ncbi:hypothetical protein ABT294_46600 [Nonomuraea sp. NPDC000554]|uniref:hypothetical protein n=1 Tax=Nonomuraea sp. NPDC000554 TaxID=3154259 RepID=UPI00331DA8F7
MAAELEVDHALLARYADGLGDAHARTRATVRAYLAEMASFGRPWGVNNEVGQAIDTCFGAVHEAYTQCQQDNLGDYAAYPETLHKTAVVHRSAEDASMAPIHDPLERTGWHGPPTS